MKKIFAFLLVLVLILAIPIPASAVTPPLAAPDMPEIPDISDDFTVELSDEFWDNYFEEHPPVVPRTIAVRDWLHGWRWNGLMKIGCNMIYLGGT